MHAARCCDGAASTIKERRRMVANSQCKNANNARLRCARRVAITIADEEYEAHLVFKRAVSGSW